MHRDTNNLRVLALDLRTGRFGFAVLEGFRELLEWGTRRSRDTTTGNPTLFIRQQLSPLLKRYAPSVIVVKRGSRQGGGRNSRQENLLNAIVDEARRHEIEMVIFGRKGIRSAFPGSKRPTKEAIANKIAGLFPQLTWKLPSPRKAWANEAHSMTVFDAVSVALAYLARFDEIPSKKSKQSEVLPPT